MHSYIISIMSHDRSGIVAGATQTILSLGGDVASVKQTLLYEYFSMILAVQFDQPLSEQEIADAICQKPSRQDWKVSVCTSEPLESQNVHISSHDAYVITVRGTNHTGIVNGVAKILSEHDINILDLETQLHDGLYVLAAHIDLSNTSIETTALTAELQQFATANQLTITMQHNDIFRATNDIRL